MRKDIGLFLHRHSSGVHIRVLLADNTNSPLEISRSKRRSGQRGLDPYLGEYLVILSEESVSEADAA
jgi:hypothetical protein